jgi:predicted transcriptional regulator
MDLRIARVHKRLTQWDLALRAGLSQAKISLIERGYVSPRDDEKEMLAELLELKVSEIEWPQIQAAAEGSNG